MTTLETRRNMQLMQAFSAYNGNRRRKPTLADIACMIASAILYTGCAVSIVLLILTAVKP